MDRSRDCNIEWSKSEKISKYKGMYAESKKIVSDQIRSVAQSCPTLRHPMNHSTPGLPVHHQLPEFTQTHVHWVSDAIQPSHPLLSPSPAPNPSQHQSLFQWVNSSHEVYFLFAKQKLRHRCREQTYGFQRGRGWWWLEIGIGIYTLLILCIEQITNKNLLYSRGNSTQCSVVI